MAELIAGSNLLICLPNLQFQVPVVVGECVKHVNLLLSDDVIPLYVFLDVSSNLLVLQMLAKVTIKDGLLVRLLLQELH